MSVKLVILGLLMEGDKHPYEINQLIKERDMNHYVKIQKGSLYYAFEQLEKHNFISIAEIVQDSNRPDKTIYHITSQGEDEFNRLLLEEMSKEYCIIKPTFTALTFAAHGNQEEMATILKQKIEESEQTLKKLQRIYEKKETYLNRANLYILSGSITHMKTEIKWLYEVYEDAVKGHLHLNK